MESFLELLSQNAFLKTLFGSIPCGVLVVDHEGRVQAVNNVLERMFGISSVIAVGKRGGEALRCVHAFDDPQGCGFAEYCKDCEARAAALAALKRNQKFRTRASLQLSVKGKVHDLLLLISATPFEYEGRRFAIVVLEDITKLSGIRTLKAGEGLGGLVGRDIKMLELFNTIMEVSQTDVPVLIQGESGTGKELVALAIHDKSHRAGNHFVPVHCAALPETLIESELFGHVKGAFTGAIRDKKGRFELADGGTIFLDEVGELNHAMQVKLLRVLQEGKLERVGSERTFQVDVRVISATNRNLEEEVEAGRFRKDLYYRICVVPITLPTLRERRDDIPLLAEHFLARAAEEAGRKKLVLSSEALSLLTAHPWPGNVRELQNAIQFALIKCRGQRIEPEHLPHSLRQVSADSPAKRRQKRKLLPEAVAAALEKANGNRARAAKILGVSRSTLYRFLEDMDS